MDDVIDGYVAAETKLSNILEKNCINNILYKLIIKTKQDSKYACLPPLIKYFDTLNYVFNDFP